MLDQKPYLVRAIYDWILDSGYTPYMQLLVDYPGVDIPKGFDDKGVLVLNISPQATNQLTIGKDVISFWARFRGQPMGVTAPIGAILAVFAKENGEGMGFDVPDIPQPPQLSVVSSRDKSDSKSDSKTESEGSSPNVTASSDASESTVKRDRSHLRVIK